MTPDRPISEVVDDVVKRQHGRLIPWRDANVVFYLLIWGETQNTSALAPNCWVYQWCLF